MKKRYLYGLFLSNGRWTLDKSLKRIQKTLTHYGGNGTIRKMETYSGFSRDYPSFDAPTFYVLSDPL